MVPPAIPSIGINPITGGGESESDGSGGSSISSTTTDDDTNNQNQNNNSTGNNLNGSGIGVGDNLNDSLGNNLNLNSGGYVKVDGTLIRNVVNQTLPVSSRDNLNVESTIKEFERFLRTQDVHCP